MVRQPTYTNTPPRLVCAHAVALIEAAVEQ